MGTQQPISRILRFGKYLVNGKVLRRIREKRLVGPAGEQAIQLAGIDFTGDQDVLPRGNPLLDIVVHLVVAVEG